MTKDARASGLVMDVRQGECIALGDGIRVEFLAKSGRLTRVRIVAPREVQIRKDIEQGEDSQHAAQSAT